MSTEPGRAPLPPPALWPALLPPAREAVNRLLAMDPSARERLAPLEGRSLEVHLTGLPAPLRVEFTADGLAIAVADEADPGADATLSASPSVLVALAVSGGRSGSTELTFRGDIGVIQEVRQLFGELDIDWEEQLSRVMGDVAAHQLGNAVRGFGGWLRHAAYTLADNAGEYLTEERRALPSALEVEGFVTAVDRLRQDADRLQARIRRLQQQGDGEG